MLKQLQDRVNDHLEAAATVDWNHSEDFNLHFVASNKVYKGGKFNTELEAVETLADALATARDEMKDAKTDAAKNLAEAELVVIAAALKVLTDRA